MKHEITSSIEINAPLKMVWNEFSNFESYPEWNPFILSLEGRVEKGKRISIQFESMKIKPIVLSFIKEKELVWKGRLIFPGIFDGTHSFRFEKMSESKTRLIHSEKFNGILVGLMKKQLDTKILDGFKKMNEKLKFRAEKSDID